MTKPLPLPPRAEYDDDASWHEHCRAVRVKQVKRDTRRAFTWLGGIFLIGFFLTAGLGYALITLVSKP